MRFRSCCRTHTPLLVVAARQQEAAGAAVATPHTAVVVWLPVQGSKRTLQYEDIFDIPPSLQTKNVYPGFQSRFQGFAVPLNGGTEKERRQLQRALDGETSRFVLYSIFGQHKLRLLYALILQCFYSGVQFVGPLMLNHIVRFLSASQALDLNGLSVSSSQLTEAWLYAMGMFLAPVVGTLAAGQANRISIGTQVMIRAELTAAIYRKALRLSTRAKQMTETGRIVNLMSADVNQLQSFFYPFASQLVTGPAMLVTSLVLLWFQIRWATFIGLGILLVSTPATTIFLKKIIAYRREMLKHTDTRVKLMNQLLVGIRVLKMYACEAAQEAVVLEVRRKELGELRKAIPHRVGLQTLLSAAPTLAMVVCFVVYGTVVPSSFTPANIFTSIALFALMRFPLIFLPFALVSGGAGGSAPRGLAALTRAMGQMTRLA
jgi:ABC-type multidrug transport system fused ATPase/permease subunit